MITYNSPKSINVIKLHKRTVQQICTSRDGVLEVLFCQNQGWGFYVKDY